MTTPTAAALSRLPLREALVRSIKQAERDAARAERQAQKAALRHVRAMRRAGKSAAEMLAWARAA
jgi:exonuclease VII large subunit